MNTGLVGYWTFDGPKMTQNVADSSGQGNHGALKGQAATTTVAGKIGQALSFDGVDDFVSTTDIDLSAISMSAWIKLSASVAQSRIVSNWTSPYSYLLSFNDTGTQVQLATRSGGSTGLIHTSGNCVVGVWCHIVAVYDNSTFKIYRNAVDETVVDISLTGVLDNTNDDVVIGADSVNHSFPFPGSLDDVRIYNRALSSTEIRQLYNQGAGTKVASSPLATSGTGLNRGLVGYWTFDGPKMTQNVADSSGQGNHGALKGQAATTTVAGKIGQALSFDGVDDYVSVTNGSSLINSDSHTVSMWFKVNSVDSAPVLWSVVSLVAAEAHEAFVEIISDTGLTWGYRAEADLLTYRTYTIPNISSGWHQLVTVKTGATTGDLYLDGVLQSSYSGNFIANVLNNTDVLVFAEYITTLGFVPLKGSLDDVRIYNRVLSTSEISQLYNQGAGTKTASSPKVGPTTCSTGLSCGLVGYWTFDGPKMTQNVADSSGQGNTGYLFGQISTTSAQGKIGQALYFDGTDDRISVSGSLTIGAWPYTYCAWVKPQDSGHVFDNIISNLGLSFILIDVDAGDSYYNLYNNASGNLNSAAGSVVFDKWQHVCGIAYANDTASFYIDGTLSVGPSAFQSNQFTDYPVYIGAGTSDPTSGNFKGNIDDVRIYNKALSATEVLQLYNLGR